MFLNSTYGATVQKITERFLKDGQSKSGGWNKAQLSKLGVSWPPPAGWKQSVIGQLVDEKTAQEFLKERT